jgi:hypothetical protein
LVFVGAVNLMMDQLRHHSPHLAGWGFGGVGVGIAASGLLVFILPADADWRSAWWAVGVLAAVLVGGAWAGHRRPAATPEGAETAQAPRRRRRTGPWFAALFLCYTLEGVGYIVAGTFLVAAIEHNSPGWLGKGAWVVGLAAAPSAALWAWLSGRFSHPDLLAGALLLQAGGIALPAVAPGPVAALITGVSQGIGAGLVSAYRKLGYAVVANSRTITQSDDPMVLTVPGDLGGPGVGTGIIDAAVDRFGRVDTLVNNGASSSPSPSPTTPRTTTTPQWA